MKVGVLCDQSICVNESDPSAETLLDELSFIWRARKCIEPYLQTLSLALAQIPKSCGQLCTIHSEQPPVAQVTGSFFISVNTPLLRKQPSTPGMILFGEMAGVLLVGPPLLPCAGRLWHGVKHSCATLHLGAVISRKLRSSVKTPGHSYNCNMTDGETRLAPTRSTGKDADNFLHERNRT